MYSTAPYVSLFTPTLTALSFNFLCNTPISSCYIMPIPLPLIVVYLNYCLIVAYKSYIYACNSACITRILQIVIIISTAAIIILTFIAPSSSCSGSQTWVLLLIIFSSKLYLFYLLYLLYLLYILRILSSLLLHSLSRGNMLSCYIGILLLRMCCSSAYGTVRLVCPAFCSSPVPCCGAGTGSSRGLFAGAPGSGQFLLLFPRGAFVLPPTELQIYFSTSINLVLLIIEIINCYDH